jgi:DNA-binding LytR/AlgR family response regulator
MRVLIVDDEPLAAEVLQVYLAKLPDMELVATCRNALEAFAMLNKQPIDLLLLDINMPELNGIDFLKSLKQPPQVIFTTAYTEHAVTSYDLGAVDYLVKPIAFDRFLKAIQKVNVATSQTQQHTTPTDAGASKTLFVRSDGKWLKIDVTKIWFVEGLKDYVRIWSDEGRVTVHSTMKNFEEQLKPFQHFARVHKSYIINLNCIDETDESSLLIKKQLIPIGGTYRDEVIQLIHRNRLG